MGVVPQWGGARPIALATLVCGQCGFAEPDQCILAEERTFLRNVERVASARSARDYQQSLDRYREHGRAQPSKVGNQKSASAWRKKLHVAQKCRGDDRPECPILDDFESGTSRTVYRLKKEGKSVASTEKLKELCPALRKGSHGGQRRLCCSRQ
jgi:hypothetical protein